MTTDTIQLKALNKSQTAFYLAVTVPTGRILNVGSTEQKDLLFKAAQAGEEAMCAGDTCDHARDLYRDTFCTIMGPTYGF